jgi:glycosidase
MAGIRALLDGYAQRFMVCEVPGDPEGFARMGGSAFAFDLNRDLVAFARGGAAAAGAAARVARYFERAPHALSTLLSNHDSFAGARVADQLHGQGPALRIAAAACLLLPGTPFVYYGEEVGMTGHPALPGDLALRTPMSWSDCPRTAGFTAGRPFRPLSANAGTHNVASQHDAPGSLLSFYRSLIGLRRTRGSLLRGDYRVLAVEGAAWAFARRLGAQCTVVAFNPRATPARLALSGVAGTLRPLLPGWTGSVGAADAPLEMPARSVAVFALE